MSQMMSLRALVLIHTPQLNHDLVVVREVTLTRARRTNTVQERVSLLRKAKEER